MENNRPPTSSGRPPTGVRPFTSTRPPSTARAGPPGTASRLISASSNRPGSRTSAVGVGVASHINISERPMSQQGLATPRTTTTRTPRRQVQDKSYYLGLLRSKISELTSEIGVLNHDLEVMAREQATYLTYEKRAEALASELKDLQGQLADYNLLVDKLNTDTEVSEVLIECSDLKMLTDREAQIVEQLFEHKQEKENQIKQLEAEIEQEKHMTDNLIQSMEPQLREKYNQLKTMNQMVLEQQEQLQIQIDNLSARKASFEEELSLSQMKQEAFSLFQRLRELEEKRDTLLEEEKARGTPGQERERLLQQVKEDNAELASMERQAAEVKEQMAQTREELDQIEAELADHQGERAAKYMELRKREETMTTFLNSFDETWESESQRRTTLENEIVSTLEAISRSMAHFHHLPTPGELSALKEDLIFKEGEMEKSRSTATTLEQEHKKLSLDLQKIEQLENKIETEMQSLKSRMKTMEEEMAIYSDLDLLRKNAEMKRSELMSEKESLTKRREVVLEEERKFAEEYEALKNKLAENETWTQLMNLQRRWQHLEQSNHALQEFIASRKAEADWESLKAEAFEHVNATNRLIQEHLQVASSTSASS